MPIVREIAEEIVAREGGYVNDPDDPGGATNHGVTLATLRGNLALGAASSQQAGGTLAATAGAALQAMGSAAAGQGIHGKRASTRADVG